MELPQNRNMFSAEDLNDAAEFIAGFSEEISVFPGRLTGSMQETACARTIRSRLEDETEVNTRMEAYKAYPMLGRGIFPFWGLWCLAAYALYFLSFAGKRVAGILLTLLALLVFVSGTVVMLMLFFGDRKLSKLLSSKVSYNVVSEFTKPESNGSPRTVVIADNHDAALGSYFGDAGFIRRVTLLAAPVSAFVFILFCVLKMALGTETNARVTAFAVVPAVLGTMGTLTILLHYSPFEKHCRRNNGVATSVAMAAFAYFAENPEFMPDNTRVVYVSFGGENSGHGGSAAFMKAHPEYADADILCLGDICDGSFKIAESDAFRRIHFSDAVISAIRGAAHKYNIELSAYGAFERKLASVHGYASDCFAKNGIRTATILTDYRAQHTPQNKEIEKMFVLTASAVYELLNSSPATGEERREEILPQTGASFVDAVGK